MLKIFVAGASSELDRCRQMIRRVDSHPLMTVTHDWTADILSLGAACPESDDEKRPFVEADLAGIERADVFVGLLPREGRSTRGLWFELCHALHSKTNVLLCGPTDGFLYSGFFNRITTEEDDDLFLVLEEISQALVLKNSPAQGEA